MFIIENPVFGIIMMIILLKTCKTRVVEIFYQLTQGALAPREKEIITVDEMSLCLNTELLHWILELWQYPTYTKCKYNQRRNDCRDIPQFFSYTCKCFFSSVIFTHLLVM